MVAFAPIGSAAADAGLVEGIFTRHMRARGAHVGEYGIRADEHVVCDFEPVIETDIVLDHDAVADDHAALDKYIMRKLAVAPDARTRQYDAMLPEPRAGADHGILRNFRARMRNEAHARTASIKLAATRSTCARVISGKIGSDSTRFAIRLVTGKSSGLYPRSRKAGCSCTGTG